MKKILITFLVVLIVLLAVSCATVQSDLPWFVPDRPVAIDAIYGVGFGKLSALDLSITAAELNARADIANHVDTTIKQAIIQYAQEAGVDDSTQTIKYFEKITLQITNQTLSGMTTKRVDPMKDGSVWVLMEYRKESLITSFEEVAKEFERNDDSDFAEFKADQALTYLSNELENNPTQTTTLSE